ncbi:MAG TPA: flagellar hook capping FlgD N-terminal domain-containing protein [Burkholderiaceae bacterium]
MTTAVSSTSSSSSSTASSLAGATDVAGSQDRFLKLLVTQLQNQDPLSPMDNAELTSQIAQINTVTGITNLNSSVQALSGQFLQMQTLQGASLIGKDVIVPGNKLDIANGVGQGGFELASAADSVKVEVLNAAGTVVDTVQLGACSSGVNGFNWNAGTYDNTSGLTFRVTAMSGATKLDATPLMRDTVNAVSTSGSSLVLELDRSGETPYSSVKAIN